MDPCQCDQCTCDIAWILPQANCPKLKNGQYKDLFTACCCRDTYHGCPYKDCNSCSDCFCFRCSGVFARGYTYVPCKHTNCNKIYPGKYVWTNLLKARIECPDGPKEAQISLVTTHWFNVSKDEFRVLNANRLTVQETDEWWPTPKAEAALLLKKKKEVAAALQAFQLKEEEFFEKLERKEKKAQDKEEGLQREEAERAEQDQEMLIANAVEE